MTRKFDGQLEIDSERGVVYFHSAKTGATLLRIGKVPTPIPNPDKHLLDILVRETMDGEDSPFPTLVTFSWSTIAIIMQKIKEEQELAFQLPTIPLLFEYDED